MKLRDIDPGSIYSGQQVGLAQIENILYAVDPAFLHRLDQRILVELVNDNLTYKIQVAEVQAKLKSIELNALKNIQQKISKYR